MLERSEFVKPYFIEELDCEGLSAADIAKSLGVEPKFVRQKLRRGFFDRLKSQGFLGVAIATPNDITGLEFEEFFLDISASKFFVAKYDSDLGDAYLAFLINLEKRVVQFEAEIKADPLMREIMALAQLRRDTLAQDERISKVETKVERIEAKEDLALEAIKNMMLSTIQKKLLKNKIDAKCMATGDPKNIGRLQKAMKAFFNLNPSNDKWYHIAQRDYERALKFVDDWQP